MNARLLIVAVSLPLIVQTGPTRAGSRGTPEQPPPRQVVADSIADDPIEEREEARRLKSLVGYAEIGNEAALDVLDAKLAQSRARAIRIGEKVEDRIEVTRKKVLIRLRMRELGPDDQFKELFSAFLDSLAGRSSNDRILRIWLVQQLGALELEESKDFLRRVAFDPAIEVHSNVRYRAERAADPGQPESFYQIKVID